MFWQTGLRCVAGEARAKIVAPLTKSSINSDWLVRCGKPLPCLLRVHIEQGATRSGPDAFVPLEYGAGVADVSDCGNVFHITAFDRFKPQVNGNQQIRLIRRAIAEQDLSRQPFAIAPPQATWKAGRGCKFKVLTLKRFTMSFKLKQQFVRS